MFLNPSGNQLADAAMNRHKSRVDAGEKLPTVAQGRYISALVGGMETFCPGRDQMYPGGVVTCAEALYDMGVDRDSANKVLDRIVRSGCQDDFSRCQEILRQECSINLGPPSPKMAQQREKRLRASAARQYGGTHDNPQKVDESCPRHGKFQNMTTVTQGGANVGICQGCGYAVGGGFSHMPSCDKGGRCEVKCTCRD